MPVQPVLSVAVSLLQWLSGGDVRGPCPCVLYKLPWQGFLFFSLVLLALFPPFCSCLREVEAGRGEGWRLG